VRVYGSGLVSNTARTSPSDQIGPLVGGTGSFATDAFYSKDTVGPVTEATSTITVAGSTGLSLTEMLTATSFTNWDFDTVWQIEEGQSFPYLRNAPQVPPPIPVLPVDEAELAKLTAYDGTGDAPTPAVYLAAGIFGVDEDNVDELNELLATLPADDRETRDQVVKMITVYQELKGGLDRDLKSEDLVALGLGSFIGSDDNIISLLNELIRAEDKADITAALLQELGQLAANVVGAATGPGGQPATLDADDLAQLAVTGLDTPELIALFNSAVGSALPSDVNTLDKLSGIAATVVEVSGGNADADYAAVGLVIPSAAEALFNSVIGSEDTPIGLARLTEIVDGVTAVVAGAAGISSPQPLSPALLEAIGVDIAGVNARTFPEVVIALADADLANLDTVAKVQIVINQAIDRANTFALTVVNGSLSGDYIAGRTITVTANSAPDGFYFAGWTPVDLFANAAAAESPVATLTMPGEATTVTANYAPIPEPKFTLTVTNGTGGGSFEAGTEVTISANLPAEDKVFAGWTGGAGQILNPLQPVTTVIVADAPITVTATYEDKPIPFALNVVSGTGSGEYEQGDRVNIAANPASDGQRFDRWMGDVQLIANPSNPNTQLTMPGAAALVIAAYIDIPQEELPQTLTITNGEGSGSYLPGTAVTISADVPDVDQLFDRWRGDTAFVTNVNDATTTVNMPAGNITLRASYRDAPPTEYVLTVEGGSGSGDYVAGDVVTLSAGLAPAGKVFDQWTGQTARVANVNQPNTTLTMPESAVAVRAVYKDLPAQTFALTVEGGSGDGDYSQGRVISIAAAPAATDEVFDRWIGQTAAIANVNQANTTLTMPGSSVSIEARYVAAPEANEPPPTLRTGGGRGGRGRALSNDMFLQGAGAADGSRGTNKWSANSGIVMRGRSVRSQEDFEDFELIEQTVPAGSVVLIEAPDEPTGFYFDKWVGQTAFVDNIHQPRASVFMPNHDVTVLAQYRSFDGTTTITLAPNQISGTAQTLSTGEAGAVVALEAEPSVSIGGLPFVFDFWEGQTATVANVLLPETTVRLSNADVELRPVYRAKPDGTVAVTVPSGTTDIDPGSYFTLSEPTPPEGLAFERWTGQTGTVEAPDNAESRLYVGVNAIALTAQFIQAADPDAVNALVVETTTPTSVDVYTDAGVTDATANNLSAYNDALVVLRAAATTDAPLTIEAVSQMVTTYNSILSGTESTLTAEDYAKIGVEVSPAGVALLNNGVAAADSADVDTVAEVQAIANAANTIAAFAAGTAGASAPAAADYTATGLTSIAANVPAYNSALAATEAETVVEIQALIAAYDKLLDGTALTEAEFEAIGVTFLSSPSATELALINDAGKQANTAIGTVTEVQAIVTAAQRLLAVADDDTVNPALTLADFQSIGVIGVTQTNLDEVVEALGEADASTLDTVAKLTDALGDLSDPEKVAELVAFDGTGQPPAAAVYEGAGVGGVDEDNLSAYASALAAVDIEEGEIEAIQAVVDTYNSLLAAAESGNAPSLDSADYAKIGVEVSPAGVALLNNGVAAADSADVDTVVEVQVIADAADRLATLASAGTGTPTADDYSAVGIAAVVGANAGAYNSAVKQTEAEEVADIQKVVTAYNTILSAAGSAGASGLTAANYGDIGVEDVTATTLGLLNSAVGSQTAVASNTVAKLQAMATAVARILATASTGQDAGLTVADFAALGIQGINDGSLTAATDVVAEADVDDVQTIAALQALLSEVLTPPLPVPTLSFWALMAMALLLMAMASRQPGARRRMH